MTIAQSKTRKRTKIMIKTKQNFDQYKKLNIDQT